MSILGDAFRQVFMPKREYESLRDEDKALFRLQRSLLLSLLIILWLAIFISTVVSLKIVFPGKEKNRPFCGESEQLNQLPLMDAKGGSSLVLGAFYLTDQETVDYFWMVVFLPSVVVFQLSVVFLLAGIAVAYSAPARHQCLMIVDNDFCTSQRGGVHSLSVINATFAIVYGLLAIFLGPSLLTLENSCSSPLFWSYEIAAWGLVILCGGTAFFLRRKAAVILDDGEFAGRNIGLEMVEATPFDVTSGMERRVGDSFKTWMGSTLLSSDEEEDELDSYLEVPRPTTQRL